VKRGRGGAKFHARRETAARFPTFRLATLEKLIFSRPVDQQLTARNEPVMVSVGAKGSSRG
jgi:hypothetical protein